MSIDYRPKELPKRRKAFVDAWTEYAADQSFAGMTLEEFKTVTQPTITTREELDMLEARMAGLKQTSALADIATREALRQVANSIRGNKLHGDNSSLYRAIGFVPTSERSSGLTRRGTSSAKRGTNAA